MNTAQTAAEVMESENEEVHWFSRLAFPVVSGLFLTTQAAIIFSVYQGWLWLTIPLALFASHLMHGQLIAFHEASHGALRTSRKLNEIDGMIIGILSLVSFSLYRAAHQTHHAHLGTVRDEEFWPFVDPSVPRWKRRLFAFMELNFGLIFTPVVFIRTFFRKGSPIRNKKVRRRIWSEFILTIVVWATIITTVAWFSLWDYFLWVYFVPGFIAGNLQSWRKYIEHVGLTGSTIRSGTRSIIADNWIGKIISFTLLHEPFHGVHHQRAGIPHAEMPLYKKDLMPTNEDETHPFPSYWHAFLHLLKNLSDPKVGAQWRTAPSTERAQA